jgi:hypothetical protein
VPAIELVWASVGALLELALLVAIVRARRYRYCYAFAVYIGAELCASVDAFLSPAVYRSWATWVLVECVLALIRLVVVTEIVLLVFRALPRARARAVMLLLVSGAVLALALLWPYDLRNAYTLAKDLSGRFAYATVWTVIAVLGLVAWHRVPLHHFHKALLHGILWLLVAQFGGVYAAGQWSVEGASLANGAIKVGVYLLWLRAAWMADPPLGPEEVVAVRYLQPWRAL